MSAIDILYKDTVTVFTRTRGNETDTWIPTVLSNVHLISSRSSNIAATYGEHTSDNAQLHVRYSGCRYKPNVQGKTYVKPKEYARLENKNGYITFSDGEYFDFFIAGVWKGSKLISDSDYTGGFFNYMNKAYDDVFAIASVSQFDILSHFEITAR